MASPFAEAIMASMSAGLDPMNGIAKDYAAAQVDTLRANLVVTKADTIAVLNQRIAEAKATSNDGNVIAAYQKLLDQVTASR